MTRYFIPVALQEKQIAEGVARVVPTLPEVVRVRHSLANDWSGDPSVYFKVVLTNRASREKGLYEVAKKIRDALIEATQPDDLGLLAYFNFRSAKEQAEMRDEAWA